MQVNTRISPEKLQQQLSEARAQIEQLKQQLGSSGRAAAAHPQPSGPSAQASADGAARVKGQGSQGGEAACGDGSSGSCRSASSATVQQGQKVWYRNKQLLANAASLVIPMVLWAVEDWCEAAARVA